MKFPALFLVLVLLGAGCLRTASPEQSIETPAEVEIEAVTEVEVAPESVPEQKEVVPEKKPEEKKKEEKPEVKEQKPAVDEGVLYENQSFSLRFPGEFLAQSTPSSVSFEPKQAGKFPSILTFWQIGSKTTTPDEMLKIETAHLQNLCSETDACGEIIETKAVKLDSRQAVSYSVKVPGRAQDDKSGYIMRYHYAVPILRMEYDSTKYPQDTKKYPFWFVANFVISASDLQKPEQVKKQFDAIMATIKLQ